ncbi:adenosylcobinamide-GDP ribazoletransferase [Gordonia sp. CPCC 205515]|uniref:adenosylcobinamide-GDP ribazoletransferase n=1 Tax=Gordonia sp. CPCC 205515 TaxID=3140791 RepID=UPI003AF3A463
MPHPIRAAHVAVSWLTVFPVPQPRIAMDRIAGGAAISATPVVGMLLGILCAAIAFGLDHTDLPTALIGVLLVTVLAIATRGMHLDGLADTADGLGCYGPPERVAEVMRSGTVGPFGVATLVAVMLVQALGFGALTDQHRWYDLVFVVALGRLGAVIGARRGLPPAHPTGFGALVANTQRVSIAVWATLAALGAFATGFFSGTTAFDTHVAIQSLVVVVVVLGITWGFTKHCARRAGGVTGDSLGAAIELGTAIAVVGLLL